MDNLVLALTLVFVMYILYMNHLLLAETKRERRQVSPLRYCSTLAGRCFLWPTLGWYHGWYGGYRYFDPAFGWFFY